MATGFEKRDNQNWCALEHHDGEGSVVVVLVKLEAICGVMATVIVGYVVDVHGAGELGAAGLGNGFREVGQSLRRAQFEEGVDGGEESGGGLPMR